MSKKANPTLIGAFVLGAIALTVFTLIVLGAGKVFSEREIYEIYFDGSIQGLREGANVNFRGVRIGQVRKVYVRFDESMLQFDLPVIIELEPGAIRSVSGKKLTSDESGVLLASLIERGLRAQLEMESFVTGQLLVNLDFYPEEPAIFRGQKSGYREIPTIPSDIQLALENVQKIIERFKELPVEDLLGNLTSTIQGIETLVNSPDLINTIKGFEKLVNAPETQQITTNLQNSIEQLDATVSEIKSFVQHIDRRVNPIADDVSKTMDEIQTAVIEMQKIFHEVREDIQDDTIRHELNTTLVELRNAARSFRVFMEYLDTHPEALIQGKPN